MFLSESDKDEEYVEWGKELLRGIQFDNQHQRASCWKMGNNSLKSKQFIEARILTQGLALFW